MNQSNKLRFLLEWFYLGNFGIEVTIFLQISIINNVTKCLPSVINQANALQHSPLTILCISRD